MSGDRSFHLIDTQARPCTPTNPASRTAIQSGRQKEFPSNFSQFICILLVLVRLPGKFIALVQLLDFIKLVAELLDNLRMAFPEVLGLEGIF